MKRRDKLSAPTGLCAFGLAVIGLCAAVAVHAADSALLGKGKAASALLDRPVRTTNGPVSGVPGSKPGVVAFKGIPFAAPPVGELRWKPAQPSTSWEGVRAGDKFGPVCMQP